MCTYNICQFHHKRFFSQFSQLCRNEQVHDNNRYWMIIIDSRFYIIDSLSLDVSLE